MSICVWRWPMSLSASSDSPLISAASPTTTAMRSRPWRRSRASARPSAIDRPGPGVAAIEHVVRRLRAPREAADAVELAEGAEPLEPAGQELVRVGLVARCPRRSDRAAIRAGGGARWSARPRPATIRGGRRCRRRSGRSCRGSRRPAGRAGPRRGHGGRRGPGWSAGSTRLEATPGLSRSRPVRSPDGSNAPRVMMDFAPARWPDGIGQSLNLSLAGRSYPAIEGDERGERHGEIRHRPAARVAR